MSSEVDAQSKEVETADIVIRDVPEGLVAALSARAQRLGLSLDEYVRRRLAQDVANLRSSVGVTDLIRFADAFADLGYRDVMSKAWR
jgi:hypothetical protein